MIKAVVFDFFGVICSDDIFAWLKEHEEKHKGHGGGLLGFLEHIDEKIASKEAFWRAVLEEGFIGKIAAEALVVDPRVVRVIKELKDRKYKTGILSNAPGHWIEGIMSRYELAPFFDSILGFPRITRPKPFAEAYDEACETLSLRREEMLFIDDTDANVVAAMNIGIPAIHFSDAGSLRKELESRGIFP